MGKILVLFVFICYLSFIESKTFVNNESGQSNKQVTESAKFKMIQALMDKQKAAKSVGDYDEILDTTTTEIVSESFQFVLNKH